MTVVRFFFIVFALLLVSPFARAHDPAHPENDDWYQSLTVPGTNNASCCNMRDCKTVQARIRKDSLWEVYISSDAFSDDYRDPREGHAPNDWVKVPAGAVLHDRPNPTGEPVACWFDRKILCFVPGVEV